MNMILLFENDFIDPNTVVLAGRRHEHIVSVLKAEKGDNLNVGLINGPVGQGVVLDISPEKIWLTIAYTHDPVAKIPVTVISALPRPPVFRRVVAALTAMGVKKMVFIQTARVEKSFWNSPSLSEDHVRQTVILGLEQAQDTVVPEVVFFKYFKSFIDEDLPDIVKGKTAWLAHPQNAASCPANASGEHVLAVGPEGGFIDDEVEKFCRAGFQPVHLGPRILRVETAVQALVGRMMPI